jgi:hypothetical protein
MKTAKCLNCDTSLKGKFCSNCGQKADSHRITVKHFLAHDIIHGVWHFENKILYTIKQTLLRPGYAAIEYIHGKRIKYYNVFYISAVLVGISLFLSNYSNEYYDKVFHVKTTYDPSFHKLDSIVAHYQKIISLCFIPFAAINSYFLFRKARLNLPEHLIIAGFSFLGVITICLIYIGACFLEILLKIRFPDFFDYTPPVVFLILFSIGYFQAFRETNTGVWWRIILWNVLMVAEFMTILLVSALLLLEKH